MGFFFTSTSPRGDTNVTTADVSATPTIIKSKWYGKHRATSTAGASGSSTTSAPVQQPINRSGTPLSSTQDNHATRHISGSQSLSYSSSKRSASYVATRSSTMPAVTSPQRRPDTRTMTLAARLNELESSNAQGLLDDDGYRILRQNLFATFTSSTPHVPSEAPPVRITTPGLAKRGESSTSSSKQPPDSNFHVSREKAASIRSNQSRSTVSTVMTNLFRRATGRPSMSSTDAPASESHLDDTGSIISDRSRFSFSRPSASFLRGGPSTHSLSQASSTGSFNSDTYSNSLSQSQQDLRSITSSRRTGRSGLSGRGPPSAYKSVGSGKSTASGSGSNSGQWTDARINADLLMDDDEHRQTSAELKAEIVAVEAEYKRILDNYHGAEMAVQAKQHHTTSSSTVKQSSRPISQITVTPETTTFTIIPPAKDSTPITINAPPASSTPAKRTLSLSKSPFADVLRRKASSESSSKHRGTSPGPSSSHLEATSPGPSIFRNGTISHGQRKSSLPDQSSNTLLQPDLPTVRGRTSRSQSNLKSGLSSSTEDAEFGKLEPGQEAMSRSNRDLDKIRKSREDAVRRYDGRLEYLRAKLKSAEIHERLLKK
ncbi:hypothetical protein FRC03_012463 [Tulasnella sp. 419]|nr:hypothetical protein FRC03_012463 [Tulasnella sp. 419]